MELNSGNNKKKNKAKPGKGGGKSAPKKAPAKRNAKAGASAKLRISIVIITLILAIIAAGCCAGVLYVNGVERIFPNVRLDGEDIGGLSITELAAKLSDMGYSSRGGETVCVSLPMDFTLEVKGEDVCSETPVADIAQAAYDACKGSNAIVDALTYVKCLFTGMELSSDVVLSVDSEAVRAMVDGMVKELTLALLSSELTVGEDSIRVVKGASGIDIDAEEISGLIIEAFRSESYGTIVYEAEINPDNELDLSDIHETVFCEAADAYFDGETEEIVPSVVGMDFDVDEARKLWNAAQYGDEVIIPLILTQPELDTETLSQLLFRDKLSSITTALWGSTSNRINNVQKAAESVDGLILMPGEEFSYNEALGERTAANGYLPAGAYSGGETVQEYGGGICQVSSMMYYCALYANLSITSRTCHYFPVGYVSPGLDATVSWGGPEFKFVNNRDYPIRVVAKVDAAAYSVVMEFWGTDVDGSFVIMTYDTEIVYDEEYTEVEVGYKAQTYRNVYDADGRLISSRREAKSYYNYHEEDIEWPEETPEPGESPEPGETPQPENTPEPEDTPIPEETPEPEVSDEPWEYPDEGDDGEEGEQPFPEPEEPVE